MEHEIFSIIQHISIPGVAALAIVILGRPLVPTLNEWIKMKIRHREVSDEHRDAIDQVGQEVKVLGANHLHEVKDLLDKILQSQIRIEAALSRGGDISQRNQNDIKESLIYLRARLNGKGN